MKTLTKIILTNGTILLIMIIGFAIFDQMLVLRDMHGLVFWIFSIYGTAALFLINLMVALFLWFRDKKNLAKKILLTSIMIPFMAAAIIFLVLGIGSLFF